MDALRNLVSNVPHWVKRLDELSGQIEQRQIELAKFAESHPPTEAETGLAKARSLRNKGSTESLKPTDDPAAHNADVAAPPPVADATPALEAAAAAPAPAPAPAPPLFTAAATEPPLASQLLPAAPTLAVENPLIPTSTLQQQKNQVIAAAQAKARATVRKRNRSDSIVSAEGVLPKYRSRTMVLVYYDSYVQSFFEELVKFISASRNLMRKAKMAAKVAQIKRLAELEMPNDADEDDGELQADDMMMAAAPKPAPAAVTSEKTPDAAPTIDQEPTAPTTPLTFPRAGVHMRAYGRGLPGAMRSAYSRAGPRAMAGGGLSSLMGAGLKLDAFDELDKSLENAQSLCEHAAHQFLREGDCNDEIAKIKRRLIETNALSKKEIERILKEDPNAAVVEPPKSRAYRVQSMRRDPSASSTSKDAAAASTAPSSAPSAAPSPVVEAVPPPKMDVSGAKIEVDEGIEDVDWDNMPKLVYKSTRMMGRGIIR